MPRLFFAIITPDALRAELRSADDDLVRLFGADELRFEYLENSHVTLAFLGEVSREQKDALLSAAAATLDPLNTPPFELCLAAISSNSPRRARVVWAEVEPRETLTELHAITSDLGRSVGIELEARNFQPHLTLARFRMITDTRGIAWPKLPGISAPVREMVLVESVLGIGPPKHTIIARFPLSGHTD